MERIPRGIKHCKWLGMVRINIVGLCWQMQRKDGECITTLAAKRKYYMQVTACHDNWIKTKTIGLFVHETKLSLIFGNQT